MGGICGRVVMSFSPIRALVFGAVALSVGFILTAFAFAALDRAIDAPAIVPFALGLAIVTAIVGGTWQPRADHEG